MGGVDSFRLPKHTVPQVLCSTRITLEAQILGSIAAYIVFQRFRDDDPYSVCKLTSTQTVILKHRAAVCTPRQRYWWYLGTVELKSFSQSCYDFLQTYLDRLSHGGMQANAYEIISP